MVSIGNMVLMIGCVVISIVAALIPYLMISKRSSALETGLPGAIGYGFLGYIWQYVLYMFGGVFVAKIPFLPALGDKGGLLVVNFLLTILTTACTAAALYWGIYLTNQKQISIYRSAAVGIGFGLGRIGIDLIYPYAYSFYLALQINGGRYQGEEKLKNSIIQTSPGSLVSGTYKCVLMLIIVIALALIMGHYYIAKNYKMAWISVLCIYEGIMLCNAVPRALIWNSETVLDICIIVLLTIVALGAGVVLRHWFQTKQVVINPLTIVKKGKGN